MPVPVLDLRRKAPSGQVLTRVVVRKSEGPCAKGFKSKRWCVQVQTAMTDNETDFN